MLKKLNFSILRFLAIWIIPSIFVATLMFINSKLSYIFKWGSDWNANRYYSWLYFMGMTIFLFLFIALIYIFIYWFLSTQLLIPLLCYKKTFQIIWSILFGIGMSLFVIFNSFGSITFVGFFKMIIIMGIVGWFISFLDFKLQVLWKKRTERHSL